MGLKHDLIYTDENRNECGVIQHYDIDLDLAGKKDFTIDTDSYELRSNYYWFVADSEYGGVIDKITSNVKIRKVRYEGRSFRGILASKIIFVPDSYPYISAQGPIDDAINILLSYCEVQDLFTCDAVIADASVSVDVNYRFIINCTLYDGIMSLAKSINMNLSLKFNQHDHKIHITPTIVNDFVDILTYTKDNAIDFKVENKNNSINHLICVNTDSSGLRKTIHLFTDKNGGIQPYANCAYPLQDSDYIIDKSKQLLFGLEEIVDMYDAADSKQTVNYKPLLNTPNDWISNSTRYYKKEINTSDDGSISESYKAVELVDTSSYILQSYQPSDWSTNCEAYFTKSDTDYNAVNKETSTTGHTVITVKPSDWDQHYSDYYIEFWDGTKYIYNSVESKQVTYYKLQTDKPTDWNSNWKDYWTKTYNKKLYCRPVGMGHKQNKVPVWRKNHYYTQYTDSITPQWPGKVWKADTSQTAPVWQANTYYTKSESYQPTKFIPGEFFEEVIDNYAEIVSKGIEKLTEAAASNVQTLTLSDFDCNIGDIVGGKDYITGLSLSEPVANIIVKIIDGVVDLEYEIGGN